MPADELDGSQIYDAILDRILAGEAPGLELAPGTEERLSPEQREELQALARVFGKKKREAVPESEEPPPFKTVAGFRLLRKLGGGGAGVVWLARQAGLDRSVALKMLRPGLAFSREAAARFEREGQALARLRHPGIVSVIASGEEHGIPWIAMEYVAGEGLDEILKTGDAAATRPPIIKVVAWCRDVARALACAHAEGIIHRDVKPSNIRITYEGNAVLVDFGLAWQAGIETLTQTGSFRGSPRYASPEQVSTRSGSVDGRTDVYSLGVTLYEAVTGRPPYLGDTTEQLFASIIEGDPTPPRQIRPDVPRELETVILTAMERDPKLRYASAAKLADDLDALLGLRDILAKPPNAWRRIQKTARRHPVVAWSVVAIVILGAALGISHVVRSAAQRRAALDEAGTQLASYRETRDRAAALELQAVQLDTEAELRPLSAEELVSHGRGDGSARAARLEAEALFQSAFDRAANVLAVDGSSSEARDLLADLCIERWRESLRTDDPRMLSLWSERVRSYDPRGRYAAELAGLGKAALSLEPASAVAHLFRFEEEAEAVPGGARRLVPVPMGGAPPGVRPGTWCLRVVEAVGDLDPSDLVLEVGGHPIEGTCFVDSAKPPAKSRDVLVSIDGVAIREPAQYLISATRGGTESRALVLDRDGERIAATVSLSEIELATARPDMIASDGGIRARVWHRGAVCEMTLPKDAGYRISATPLFSSDACRATSGAQLEVAPGSWLAVVSAPGFETQRVPFVVPRRGAVDVVARLRPVGSTPRGFVHVPAGTVQRTTRARKRGGLTELGPRNVGAFDIMEREVLLGEFLQYLNDPETSEEAREAILARPAGHGDREGGVWPFVRKLANGRLGTSMVKGILPVNGVSYRDAQAYAAWLTRKARKRGQTVVFELPTELELMRAACGPDGRPYAYGAWFSPAWQKGAGARPYVFSEPPQSFPIDESMFGVYDLTGSLAEWCTRSDTPLTNQNQVVFGGSFTAWVVASLSTTTWFDADAADATFGFRLASHPERAESR